MLDDDPGVSSISRMGVSDFRWMCEMGGGLVVSCDQR